MNTKRTYTDDQLITAVKTSRGITETLSLLKLKSGGGSFTSIKRRIKFLGLDVSHWPGQSWRKGKDMFSDPRVLTKHKPNEIFSTNSKVDRSRIRDLVIKHNLIEYKCSSCSNEGRWNDEKLTLQLDHINGEPSDNRLENLRFLCPNCHSQTTTYCCKKSSGKYRVSDEDIKNDYLKTKNIRETMKNLKMENGRNYKRVRSVIETLRPCG